MTRILREEDEIDSGEDMDTEEQDVKLDGSARFERDHSDSCGGSENEWASALEGADDPDT